MKNLLTCSETIDHLPNMLARDQDCIHISASIIDYHVGANSSAVGLRKQVQLAMQPTRKVANQC